MGQIRILFVYFSSFHMINIAQKLQMIKDGVLRTQTQGVRMVGADDSTELWWHPNS